MIILIQFVLECFTLIKLFTKNKSLKIFKANQYYFFVVQRMNLFFNVNYKSEKKSYKLLKFEVNAN